MNPAPAAEMRQRRRIAAYGLCRDGAGRVLLAHSAARSVRPDRWSLPGGGIAHGEHPAEAVARLVAEQTGLAVAVLGTRDVAAEVLAGPSGLEHTDGVIYELAVTGGVPRPPAGRPGAVRWVTPAEAADLPLSRFATHALGLPPPAGQPAVPVVPRIAGGPRPRPARGQRFAAYGLATDPAGLVLLTLIAPGYPGAGRWHLPGGGTDFGEQPRDGLLREIIEESGQHGRILELIAVTHHHNRAAIGPEGYPIDWHGVRAVFRVEVSDPTVPTVVDPDGSTAEAAWFTHADAAALPLSEPAATALAATHPPHP